MVLINRTAVEYVHKLTEYVKSNALAGWRWYSVVGVTRIHAGVQATNRRQ